MASNNTNKAVKVAMATHKRFAEGDLETIINSWSKDIVRFYVFFTFSKNFKNVS